MTAVAWRAVEGESFDEHQGVAQEEYLVDVAVPYSGFDDFVAGVVENDEAELCGHVDAVASEGHAVDSPSDGEQRVLYVGHVDGTAVVVEQVYVSVRVCDEKVAAIVVIVYVGYSRIGQPVACGIYKILVVGAIV